MNKPTFKHICLMHIQQLTNFPYIEKDFDALTDYGLLCKIVDYLNQVITNGNAQNETITALYNAFVELKDYVDNYFDNLDVQDEINNKLDEMTESGELQEIIDTYLNKLIPSLKPNTTMNLNMGMTSFLRNADEETIENHINNVCKNYFSKLKQQVRFTFNESTMTFELTEEDNMEYQIQAINTYIQNGGEFAGLHFYVPSSSLVTLFETYTDTFIMDKYLTAINNFIDSLPYKNIIYRLWILNEARQTVLSDTYKTSIISVINSLQEAGYQVSIPMAYVEEYGEVSRDILNELDFYSINLYPNNDVYGEFSNIDDMKERFNTEYRIIEPFIGDKELVVSEFGCSSSWDSFATPNTYKEDRNGKPISIFIEGFFKSDFIGRISSCYLWYYMDAYRYAPNTLLSVKENTEVRYG